MIFSEESKRVVKKTIVSVFYCTPSPSGPLYFIPEARITVENEKKGSSNGSSAEKKKKGPSQLAAGIR